MSSFFTDCVSSTLKCSLKIIFVLKVSRIEIVLSLSFNSSDIEVNRIFITYPNGNRFKIIHIYIYNMHIYFE